MVEFNTKLIPLFSEIIRNVFYRKVRYLSYYTYNYIFESSRNTRLHRKKVKKVRAKDQSLIIDSFLTFTNRGYKYPSRILHQAIETGWFAQINSANEAWIKKLTPEQTKFCKKRKYDGYGLWIWKPIVIELQLESMKENEILLYCDSGMYLNAEGCKKLSTYLANLELNNEDAILFSVNGSNHSADSYTQTHKFNQKLLHAMKISYPGEFDTQIYAGLMLLKNTENARKFVKQWKEF